jgi:hypothetical protein
VLLLRVPALKRGRSGEVFEDKPRIYQQKKPDLVQNQYSDSGNIRVGNARRTWAWAEFSKGNEKHRLKAVPF